MRAALVLGLDAKLIPPEEAIWTTMYIQNRYRCDAADVNDIIRNMGEEIDWQRLLQLLEVPWELLLQQLIRFRYIYPCGGDKLPGYLKVLFQDVVNALDSA